MLVSAITKNVYLAREGVVEAMQALSEIYSIPEERAIEMREHVLGLINLFHGESV